MRDMFLKLYVKMQILRHDEGQDLIEYALVAALIALGATAAMGTLATTFGTGLNTIGTTFTGKIPAGS